MPTLQASRQATCRVLTAFAELERLAPAWEDLWESNPQREIFTSFAWARACWRAYGSCRVMVTPVVEQGDRVRGLLPLAVEQRTLRFLGAPHADYNDLLCEPGAGPDVLEAALDGLMRLPLAWDRCVLENLPESSTLVAAVRQLSPRLQARLRLTLSGSCSALNLREDRASRLRAALGKESLRRHHKKLSKLGKVRFRHLEAREEIERHLPTFFRLHVARRALAGDRSLFCRDEPRAFYRALVSELDARDALRFAVVEVDGQPVAYHLGFECAGKFIWYKPAFDVAYWDCSPGEVLLKGLLEYVAASEIEEFDFTTGEEAFKGRFANCVRQQYDLHIFPRRARGHLYHLGLVAREHLKTRPRTYGAVRGVVRALGSMFRRASAAVRCYGPGGCARQLLRKVWRAGLYARDEVLIYCHEQAATGCAWSAVDEEIDVRPGTLLDLAVLSQEYPDFLTVDRLHEARERLKRGDQLYLARRGDEFIHLAWMGLRSELKELAEIGPECRFALGEPAPVISDCWTPPLLRGQGIYPRVLHLLMTKALCEHERVWIYCQRANRVSQRGIAKAGFRLRCHMGCVRLFGRVVRKWVAPVEHRPLAVYQVLTPALGQSVPPLG